MPSPAPDVQSAEIDINAPPDAVYALISDITRTGEWSPECRRCEWQGGAAGPAVGARFRGYNQHKWMRWSRLNEVVTAEPGKEFAFRVLPDWFNKDASLWRYRLQPNGDGTRLHESTEIEAWPKFPVTLLMAVSGRDYDQTDNIRQSLQRIKQIAESGT